jgi:hypothetical protein
MRNWLVLAVVVVSCGRPNADDLFDPGAGGTAGSSPAGGTDGGGTAGASTGGTASGTSGSAGSAGTSGSASSAGTSGSAGSAGSAGDEGQAGAAQEGGASSFAGASGEGGSGGEAGSPVSLGGAGAGGDGGQAQAGSPAGGAAGEGGASCTATGDERCDGLDNDCSGGVDDGDVCPEDCTGFADETGHGYMICVPAPGMNAANAQTACQAHDQSFNLVRVDSAEENAFIVTSLTSLAFGAARYWIGASDVVENHWVWVDGTEFYDHTIQMTVNGGYENWADGRPNNTGGNEDCAVIELDPSDLALNLKWNDLQCGDGGPGFICEASD